MKSSILGTVALFFATTTAPAEVRTFTSIAGTTLKGELVSVAGDTVTIKKEDGTPLNLRLSDFSRVDQAWLQTQAKAASPGASATAPAKATRDAPFVNSLGMKFVPVPGTNVLFCTTLAPAQVYHQFNFEVNKVKLPGPDAENFDFEKKRSPSLFPISEINYDKAKAFCDWLGEKDGHVYRMPTDREWSIAIGIGSQEPANSTPEELDRKIKNQYPWGSNWPPPAGFANYCDETYLDFCKRNKYTAGDAIKGYTDGEIACSPMTAYRPNKFGLHDLSGNQLQWCEGWYDKGQTRRFLRGSMWGQSSKTDLLSSARHPLAAGLNTRKDLASSIRVVLELPKP